MLLQPAVLGVTRLLLHGVAIRTPRVARAEARPVASTGHLSR